METLSRKSVKFGETLASKVVGNPELSLEWLGKCRDLTADKSERHLEEKVHTLGKPMDKLVITLVAFLAIYPTIITSVQAVLATAGLTATFPAVASIVTLIPLVAVIGGVSIAGLIAYVAAKKGGAG
jgi:hypothetical protein